MGSHISNSSPCAFKASTLRTAGPLALGHLVLSYEPCRRRYHARFKDEKVEAQLC